VLARIATVLTQKWAWAAPALPDHGGMTIRPLPGMPLPQIVRVARQCVTDEAEALRSALEDFSRTPRPGSPSELDGKAWSDDTGPGARDRAALLGLTRHQAVLTYINAYDHMWSLGRLLGTDGAMSLFSHQSASRVACEAAVRFAWLMDPGIRSEERITRGAVALVNSAEERVKGVRRLTADRFPLGVLDTMIKNCTSERDTVRALITGAGIVFGHSKKGTTETKLVIASANISVPLTIKAGDLMAELLLDSPSWYNVGSAVTHSVFWGLRDVVQSRPGGPLDLLPDVMETGAAAEAAISASGLILDRCGRYYGHDPQAHVQRAQERREKIDALMHRAAKSNWAQLPAWRP
jgi:hypothetical protein